MLVLSRRENDSVRIGDNRRVTVMQIRGDVVRIRIEERVGGRISETLPDVAEMRVDDWRPMGDDGRVGVIDIRGDKVRLGFEVPTHVSVHRQEVCDEFQPDDRWPDEDDNG